MAICWDRVLVILVKNMQVQIIADKEKDPTISSFHHGFFETQFRRFNHIKIFNYMFVNGIQFSSTIKFENQLVAQACHETKLCKNYSTSKCLVCTDCASSCGGKGRLGL